MMTVVEGMKREAAAMNKYHIYALPSYINESWLWVLTYGLVVQATSSRWEDVVARFKMLTRRRPQ